MANDLLVPGHDPRYDWVRGHVRWFERSDRAWLGIDRVYALSLPERLAGLRQAFEVNGLAGGVSILQAFRKQDVELASLAGRGICDPPSAEDERRAVAGQVRARQRIEHLQVEVAIALGHLAVLLDFHDSGAEHCLIFEDDIRAADQRGPTRRFLESAASRDWDMLYLSYSHADRRRSMRLGPELWRLRGQLCCNAFVVRRRAAGPLLAARWPIREPVDVLYRDVAEARGYVVLGPHERIFDQDRKRIASSAHRRSPVMPPQWAPPFSDRMIAHALAFLGGPGSPRYDERLVRYNHLPLGYLSHLRARLAAAVGRVASRQDPPDPAPR